MRERRKSEMNQIKNIMRAKALKKKKIADETADRMFKRAVSSQPISPTAGVEKTFSNKKKKEFRF
tara:strand:+ start:718 stop:912 length:195 start_codon:yes stop_codon:yes gene_type:complete